MSGSGLQQKKHFPVPVQALGIWGCGARQIEEKKNYGKTSGRKDVIPMSWDFVIVFKAIGTMSGLADPELTEIAFECMESPCDDFVLLCFGRTWRRYLSSFALEVDEEVQNQ